MAARAEAELRFPRLYADGVLKADWGSLLAQPAALLVFTGSFTEEELVAEVLRAGDPPEGIERADEAR